MLLELTVGAALVLLGALLTSARVAVASAGRSALQARADAGDRRAALLLELKSDPDGFLAAMQVATVTVWVLAAAVAGALAGEVIAPALAVAWPRLGGWAETLALFTVALPLAFVALLFGDLLPRSLVAGHAERVALPAARPLAAWSRLARPALVALAGFSRLLMRLFGRREEPGARFHTLDDLRAIAAEAEQQGLVHGALVSGAVEFHDREVREVMTPSSRIVAIPLAAGLDEALRVVGESGHSRFPVHRDTLDDIAGFVYARDLYEAGRRGAGLDLQRLVRPAMLVAWNRPATALLAEMRASHMHMAVVVDEHGSTLGLVTLEDLLEVIVGEIHDEHDEDEDRVRVSPAGTVEADGAVAVRDLNADYGLRLPESDGYVTVAGLVLDKLGFIPKGGETIEVPPHRLTVLATEGHRIARVRIEPITNA